MIDEQVIYGQEELRTLLEIAKMRGIEIDMSTAPEWNAGVVAFLQENLGQKLTAFLLRTTTRRVSRWAKGVEEFPRERVSLLTDVLDITRILLSRLSPVGARTWWTTENEYLGYFIPMDEFSQDPSWVHQAALDLLAD